MSSGRRLSILAEEDDDPMLSAVNLVDVFLVLVVALLTAVALQQQSHANETVIRNPGQPGMEIVVRKDGQEIKYRGNGGSAEGQGERAGVAYKMKDGSIIYVPEAGEAGAAGTPGGSPAATPAGPTGPAAGGGRGAAAAPAPTTAGTPQP
jgi:hypothetical protein